MKANFSFAAVIITILGIVFLTLIFRYNDYVLNEDFVFYVNTSCGQSLEGCFISDCSPEEDFGCTGVPYVKVELLRTDAPKCLEEHNCESFSCENIDDCSITYCTEDTLEDGESCFSEPEQASDENGSADTEEDYVDIVPENITEN